MFNAGQVYRRRDIHQMYGGNWQSGISSSAKTPYIFIFTGASGEQYGYKDEWLNEDVFSYTGEGQSGDMQFTKGNLALREHLSTGKRVFLFEYVAQGRVKYVSELSFIDCDYFETLDLTGDSRIGIKFFFNRVGESKYTIPDELKSSNLVADPREAYVKIKQPNSTERSGLVTSRVGQGAYRKSILHRWSYKCAASGYNDTRILIASHIQPWKDSNDQERLDVDNGILLSPDYDALFDKHLISFDQAGKIILSSELTKTPIETLGITGKERIDSLNAGNKRYLENHSQLIK
ncbi:MAG: HNH endonuclease [Fulvivirga sp.]|uniref:HNH endonuclease n=1 Tax=Fulvivirga sp. TaxID=1931237 RepID=UPI0032ED0EC9